jgi:hypothetical protein
MNQVERLQDDVEQVSSIAELFAGNDSLAILHADIVGSMKANLMKAESAQSKYGTFATVNAWIRDVADSIGEPFTDYESPVVPDVQKIEAELQNLRAMLARQVVLGDAEKDGVPNLKNLRRLANTIIKQERTLYYLCVDNGIYLTVSDAEALWSRWFNAIDKSNEASWIRRADAYLDSVGFTPAVGNRASV